MCILRIFNRLCVNVLGHTFHVVPVDTHTSGHLQPVGDFTHELQATDDTVRLIVVGVVTQRLRVGVVIFTARTNPVDRVTVQANRVLQIRQTDTSRHGNQCLGQTVFTHYGTTLSLLTHVIDFYAQINVFALQFGSQIVILLI